ncbi:uncharacterized protein LOC134229736 [Saccostrea cucullata]|uniref:uncharacterized protein LOC134229736 n=1 Tax=Saccostrea cuccullata TaxID=36930 RepID=UPI002ECFBB35
MASDNLMHLLCLLLISYCTYWVQSVTVYKDCGGRFSETKGVIHSPNFPKEFPTPIRCEWVIYNPQTRNTAIYLTQFYLKGFVSVWQFEHYSNHREYIEPRQLATLNANSEINRIVSNKPYTVIRFAVSEINDINVRVLDHIVDVYGFNITYEFLDPSSANLKRTCSVQGCSYLGNCYANADFSAYKCHCFDGYQGSICQYGEHCDPAKGINQCKNGGECRYFYGTNVNICNCTKGFTGNMCEVPLSDYLPDACAYLGCGQTCISDLHGNKQCACYKDYRLNADKRTCSHIDRNRIIVTMQPTESYLKTISQTGNNLTFSDSQITKVRQDVELSLKNIDIQTMTQFSFIGINQPTSKICEFRFIIEASDEHKIKEFKRTLLRRGYVGEIPFHNTSLSIKSIPVLHLIEVVTTEESHDSFWGDDYISYTIEGKFLTISCLVRGSENTSFRWFKDGMLIDMNLAARQGYQTVINSKLDGTIRSILYYGSVKASDRGEYTCEARDYGIAQNKSDLVDVITTPMVDIDPMSDYVPFNRSIRIRCLSFDQDALQYNWYVNNVLIKRGRSDMIPETLQPAGSQLYVRSLQKRAIFTCKVTNAAGAQNVTADIYVQTASQANDTCPQQWYKSILWAEMAGGHYRKERCPAEAGDFENYIPIDTGFVTRKCVCKNEGNRRVCSWKEPNFSMCQSVSLVRIYDEMEIIRLGYRSSSLKYVFDHLYRYASNHQNRMYSGDVEIAANVLLKLLQHLARFPSLSEGGSKISFVNIVYLLDQLLTAISNSTKEEKEAVSFGSNMVGILDSLISNMSGYLEFSPHTDVLSDNIDVSIRSSSVSLVTLYRRNQEGELTVENKEYPVISIVLRSLTEMFPENIERKLNQRSVTDMYDVSLFPRDSFSAERVIGEIKIPLLAFVFAEDYSEFICLSLEKNSRYTKHEWKEGNCEFVSSDETYITCQCALPVKLQVVGIKQNETVIIPSTEENNDLLLMGCIVAMSGLAAIFIVFLLCWRKLSGEVYIIQLNFVFVLSCVNGVFILCLYQSHSEIICRVGRILAFFLYSAAFSFLLVESFHHFYTIYKKGQVGKNRFKYLAVGWGFPLVIAIFYTVASEMFGFPIKGSFKCWLQKSHWSFYLFAIPVASISCVIFVFSALVLHSKTAKTDETAQGQKKKMFCNCTKTIVLLFAVVVDAFLSMDIPSHQDSMQLIFLLICKTAMVISVFLVRVVFDKQVSKVWKCFSQKTNKSTESSDEAEQMCKGFCNCFNHPTREQEKANKYYAEVNRAKYTAERKRQLSSLLGSSAAHELPLNSPDTSSSTGSNKEAKDVAKDRSSQNTGRHLYIHSNGSKGVTFVSEKQPPLIQNGGIVSGQGSDRQGVNLTNTQARKNGYKRVSVQNTQIEAEEELTALIHSSAEGNIQRKQLL